MGITVLRGLTMGVKSAVVLESCLCVVYWNHFDDYVYVILVWLWASVQVINWKFIPRPHRAQVYPFINNMITERIMYSERHAEYNTPCGRPPRYAPAPASSPLTFLSWMWCPSHVRRGQPMCQF